MEDSSMVDIYTPLSEAIIEINKRREDTGLQQRLREFFGSYAPPGAFTDTAHFVSARALYSPNLEFLHMLDLADTFGLQPLLFEFTKDRYTALNAGKRGLGKMTFYRDRGMGLKEKGETISIIDFQEAEGKPMSDVRTLKGELLVEFHHRLLRDYVGDRLPQIHDFSDWVHESYGFNKDFPYARYLGLFISNGILLENFLPQTSEGKFTKNRVLPAFQYLSDSLGVRPLIVPMESPEVAVDPRWYYYPEGVKALL
jgi:hypothetical protein